ncbi:hypothetical protein EVAR_85682_1 [Eumeta japonica]|uniref:Uncharacterized protein n=1 Tax=Eumeta variegata TaxID=151549 RepID=A0A4C1WD60_EUMVA|nr:hypothetical protein EVAR_85682_1 [Eumeta japonica]
MKLKTDCPPSLLLTVTARTFTTKRLEGPPPAPREHTPSPMAALRSQQVGADLDIVDAPRTRGTASFSERLAGRKTEAYGRRDRSCYVSSMITNLSKSILISI